MRENPRGRTPGAIRGRDVVSVNPESSLSQCLIEQSKPKTRDGPGEPDQILTSPLLLVLLLELGQQKIRLPWRPRIGREAVPPTIVRPALVL